MTATPSPTSTRHAGAAPANALTGLIASRFKAMSLMRAVTDSLVRDRFPFPERSQDETLQAER